MRTHRNNLWFTTILGATLLAIPACGGGSDDPDSGPEPADADETPDADEGGGPVLGLGQSCDAPADCVTAPAMDCASISPPPAQGWCTFECAVTATNGQPNAAQNQMCIDAYQGTIPDQGTPACVIYIDEGTPVMRHWSCAILCGTFQTTDFGGCPGGFTCDTAQNICV